MAGSQEDTSGSLAKANDMTGSRSGENAVLADDELLDAVGGTNLGNQLDNLGVPVSAIATNDEERTYHMDQIMARVVRSGGRFLGSRHSIPSTPSGMDSRMLVMKDSL